MQTFSPNYQNMISCSPSLNNIQSSPGSLRGSEQDVTKHNQTKGRQVSIDKKFYKLSKLTMSLDYTSHFLGILVGRVYLVVWLDSQYLHFITKNYLN